MNKRGKLWLLVLLLIVVAKFAIGKLIMYSWVSRFITFEQLQAYSLSFKHYVDGHCIAAIALYIVIYALTIAIGIPGVAVLSVFGGYLFGVLPGTFYGVIGATIGSMIAFLVVRYLLRNWIKKRYGAQFKKFNDQMDKYGANYLLMVHYASIIPFFFINSLAAISDVTWWTFIWTTILGFVPLATVYSFAGRELGSMKSLHDIMSPPILVILAILILLAFLPIVIKHYRSAGQNATT